MKEINEFLRLTECQNEGNLIHVGIDLPNLRVCLFFMSLFHQWERYYKLLDNRDGSYQITNQEITWETKMEYLMK